MRAVEITMADSFISSWKRNQGDGRDDGDDDYGSARSAKDRHHRHGKGKNDEKECTDLKGTLPCFDSIPSL